jgi:hypothetical protein
LKAIINILEGRNTTVFRKYPMKEIKDRVKLQCSFSIISEARTLDLEAPSEVEKNLFIVNLKSLLAYQAH